MFPLTRRINLTKWRVRRCHRRSTISLAAAKRAPLASYFRARKLNFEWGLWLFSLLWYLAYVNICKVGFICFAEATERKTERKIAVLSLQSDVGQIHLMGVQQTKTEVFRGVRAFLVVLISDWHMQNNMRRIANNVLPFSVATFICIYFTLFLTKYVKGKQLMWKHFKNVHQISSNERIKRIKTFIEIYTDVYKDIIKDFFII